METGVVIIQEPVFTKTSVEEAPAGVILDHSSMEVDKVNLSTVLGDEITSSDCRNTIISGEADVAEPVNGSGNKETEGSEREKGEAMKTTSVVEDSKIAKEKDSETEKDEQGTIFVHESESFNKNTDDAKIILSDDVALEKAKEDDTTQKPEEVSVEKPVIEEDQTETKHTPKQEEEIVKFGEGDIEKSLDSARKEIPVKTDEVKQEEDSRTFETSVNGTEAEHNATVSVEEVSRNSESTVKEPAPEEETATNGESVHDVESTKRVLDDADKEEEREAMKTETEPMVDSKEEIETVKIVNSEETASHESEISKDYHQRETVVEPVEAIKNSDDSEQISREVTVDKEKEVDITQKTEEVKEIPREFETPTIQGEDIESKASKDTEEHEHVLVRDIPQGETLVTEAETVDSSTVQESAILKTLETKTDETDAEQSLDLKDDKEQEEAENVKTVISSDEVQESITVIEQPKTSPELKEEEDKNSKDTEEDEHVFVRNMPQGEIFVTEAETLETKEDTEPIMDLKEDKEQEETEKLEEIPSDLALKVDKEELKDDKLKADQADGTQTMEEQRGLESNEPEAEQIDRNRTDKTEEIPVEKMIAPPEKQSLESSSEVSEETNETVDSKMEEKPEEEVVTPQQEGSYGLETKEETISVPKSTEIEEKVVVEERSVIDLTPPQEESCLRNEQEKETRLEKERIEMHEPANEEVANDQESISEEKSDEVIQVSSASPSEEQEGETTGKIEDIKENEEEQLADEIQKSLETVETVDTEPVKSNEEISKSNENILNEIAPEDDHQGENAEPVEATKNSDDAEKISHEVTGDRETEEVQEIPTVIETPTIQEENIQSKHVLVRDMPQIDDTLVTEAEDVNTSTVQEVEILKTLETTTNETEVRPSDQVDDAQAEESVEVKSRETLQDESNEEKHENLLDVPYGESETFQVNEPETVLVAKTESLDECEDIPSDLVLKVDEGELKDDKTEVDKVDGTQVIGEQRGLEPNEPEAEQIDRNKSDEAEETPIEKMQSSSLECPSEVSEETSKTVNEKIKEEEVTLHQEGQEKASYGLEIKEETLLESESKDLGEEDQEEVSCLPKETKLQQEQIEKYEPTNEVPNDQQSPVEEKSDEAIQVSSASPSEEREGGIVVDAVNLEDIKANEEEQVAEKIQKSLEPLEIAAEPQSSLPSYSEEHEHETVSEKIEDEEVKEVEPIVQILSEDDATESHERQDEIHNTGETTALQEEQTRDIGYSFNEKCSMDQTQAEEQVNDEQEEVTSTEERETKANESENDKLDEHVDSQTLLMFSEKSDNETLTTAEAKKGDVETSVIDMQQGETIVTEAEALDTSTVHEAAILKTLETTINESEAVHIPMTRDTEPSLDLKEDKEQEETETVKTVILSDEVRSSGVEAEEFGEHTEHCSSEIKDESQGREESVEVKPKEIVQDESTQEKDENLLDVESGESAEKIHKPSLASPSEISEETSKTIDEKIEEKPEEEVKLHQESQEEGSYGLETKEETTSVPESTELGAKSQEEQEKETMLQKEQIEKHESTSQEETNAHQTLVEEKSDEVIQVSSASPSEERDGETVAEAEKIENIEANEEEQVVDKIQRSLETVETVEPHSSFPSPPEEHETVAEAEKKEDEMEKVTEPSGDMSEKGLEVSETKDLSLPLEESRSHGTESSELVAEFEEEKPKPVKEILEGEIKEVEETKAEKPPSSENLPQEALSDVVALQIEREDDTTDIHERKEDISKAVETKETTVAQEEQTRDIGTSLTEKCSTDQNPQDEQVNKESSREDHADFSSIEKREQCSTEQTQEEEQVNKESSREEHEKSSSIEKGEQCSTDQTKEEEHVNKESSREEHADFSSIEKGEAKTKELEDKNLDEHVDSSEKKDNEILIAKTSENVCIKQEEFENFEAPKLEESKEDKSQKISETIEAKEAKGDHTVAIETSEAYQTPSFVSELEDKIPKQIEEIHEEEETKESHKVEATGDLSLPIETSQEDQAPSLVSEQDDQTSKQVEETHKEETKAHNLQEEEILPTEIVPRESFSEAPVSMLASVEDATVQEGDCAGDTQEERHVSAETGESEGETKLKEPEAEITDKSDDQIDTSTKVTKVEDEDTKKTDTEVAESACLEQEDLKDLGTLQHDVVKEEQSPLKNDYLTEDAEHEDETLPVVGILQELQNTLATEGGINDSASSGENIIIEPSEQVQKTGDAEAESSGNDLHSFKAEPETLEKNLVTDMSEPVTNEKEDKKVTDESPASEIIEANMLQQDEGGETEKILEENILAGKSLPVEELKFQEEQNEEGKVQDVISREFEVTVEEKLKEETKEENPADQSHTAEVLLPSEKVPSSPLPFKELEHVISTENKEEREAQEDVDASITEKTSPQEEHHRDLEASKKEQKEEAHETVKEETVDIKEENKDEEVQDEKLGDHSDTRDIEDVSELGVGHDFATPQVEKEEESHSVLRNDEEINEVVTSEKQITDPVGVIEKASESNEEHIETQALEEKPSELIKPQQSLNQVEENLQVQDQPNDFEAPAKDKEAIEQEQESNDLTYVQEDNSTNVKLDVRDPVVAQKGLTEEKREVDYVKTEMEDAIKLGVSKEEKNDSSENIDPEVRKEIYQEESKQTDKVTAIKEEIREEEKEATKESFNSMKNSDDPTEKPKLETREIGNLSSISETQDKSKQKDEVPNQQKREIADEVPKIAEELQQKDGESENNKGPEPAEKEPARNSLSDLIQKVKGTDKIEDATTEPRIIEEEPQTEEEDEDGDEHKDDKTSPDSIVMVEAKDTVSITKTQHKKSQGILSGVGSKVKHSISKVKKALTGKSSHTTKPSSPK